MAEKEITLGKLGKTFTGLSGKTKEDFGFGKPYIPYINIFKNSKINPEHLEYVNIKKGEKQNQVRYGDILFTTSSETIEEVGMTSVLLDEIGEAYLNSFCFGFRLNNFDILLPEFARYLLRSEELRHKISLKGQGSTRYNLSKTELLNNLILRIPSKENQIAIARILSMADRAIAQTDALIAKYQRIKTGLMHDLLTKGIDAQGNIRSKATHRFVVKDGVEVPEEWEVGELGDYSEMITSGSRGWGGYYSVEGAMFIRITNLTREHIDLDYSDIKRVDLSTTNEGKRTRLIEGDLLISITADLGIIGVIRKDFEEAYVNQHIALVRLIPEKINPRFAGYFLSSVLGQDQIQKSNESGAKAGLNLSTIAKLKVAKPPLHEQKLIVESLDASIKVINKLKVDLKKAKSIKNGLMQDLLSGKVTVI
jgi:type I restriction enzyme S subunit